MKSDSSNLSRKASSEEAKAPQPELDKNKGAQNDEKNQVKTKRLIFQQNIVSDSKQNESKTREALHNERMNLQTKHQSRGGPNAANANTAHNEDPFPRPGVVDGNLQDMQHKFNQNHLNQSPQNFKLGFKLQNNTYKYVPLHKAPWNQRFYLSSKMNPTQAHTFYKEFFDKPERLKQGILVPQEKLDIPIEDFYRQTAMAKRLFAWKSPQKKLAVKATMSRPQAFSGAPYPSGERPTTGNAPSIARSSVSQRRFSTLERTTSLRTLTIKEINWNQNFNSRDQARPAQFLNTFKMDTLNHIKGGTARNLKSAGSRRPQTQGSTGMRRNISQPKLLGQKQNFGSTQQFEGRSLKAAQSLKDFDSTKFGNWNARIGLPISQYNEAVFKHYRLMFDHL